MKRKLISRIFALAMVTVMTFTSTDVCAAVRSTEAQSEIEVEDEDIIIDESEGIGEIDAVDEEDAVLIADDTGEDDTEGTDEIEEIMEIDDPEELTVSDNSVTADGASYGVSNPRRDRSGTVTWDCVYFGSYPQAEVVADKSTYTAIGSDYLSDGDVIEDAGLYSKLQSASFNDKGFATITYSGSTYSYKRIKKSDATYSFSGYLYHYNWSDSTTYHYFRCEPIKWRVLSVNGSDAFLLADKGLDDQRYSTTYTRITWAESTIRSWLNGYGSSVSNNFIDTAFTSGEKAAIKTTSVVNADNTYYGQTGGIDTSDKVFLLSEAEVYSIANGFSSDYSTYDRCRRSKSSTYAKAMGTKWTTSVYYWDKCYWWLRSPGANPQFAAYVDFHGTVNRFGLNGDVGYEAVRPALHLNLSSNLHTLAGTVNSDGEKGGTDDEPENPEIADVTIAAYQKITLSPSNFGTTESIAKYTLSSKKLASISKKGEFKAKKPGDVTVTAYRKNENGKYETVGEPVTVHIEKPVLNKTTLYKAGQTVSANSVILSGTSLTPIKWTSSKPSVVTVDEKTGVITAVKSGTAKITAYFGEGSNAAKYTTKVTVKIPRLSFSKVTLKAGKTKKLKIKNTSLPVSEWKSSDESVATVDENGLVIAVSAGNAVISATVDGVDYGCDVTVNSLPYDKYLVWFDANGGKVKTLNKIVTFGYPYGKLPKPTKPGARFLGWYTQKEGGEEVKASDDFEDCWDITLYARWE